MSAHLGGGLSTVKETIQMVGHSLTVGLRCVCVTSHSAIWFACDALHFTTDTLIVERPW